MVNWKVEIYNTNMVLKATYTNDSPGGIVTQIKVDLEPSGNCLEASFQGIPAQLAIESRDFIKLYFVDLATPIFYGYITDTVNAGSHKVTNYKAQGIKVLLQSYSFPLFFHTLSTPPAPGANDADKIDTHYNIVADLQQYLPYFVLGFDNQASTLSGNQVPVVYEDANIGKMLDDITKSATDGVYVWGVDGSGTLFIKPMSSATIDFTAAQAAGTVTQTYQSVSNENITTNVTFVFGIPDGTLTNPSSVTQSKEFVDSYQTVPLTTNDFDNRAVTYHYRDSTADTWGEFYKQVSLSLTPTWTKLYTINDLASLSTSRDTYGQSTSATITYKNMDVVGSTQDSAGFINVTSDNSRSTYAETSAITDQDAYLELSLQNYTTDYGALNLDDIFAVQVVFQKKDVVAPLGIHLTTKYRGEFGTKPVYYYQPIYDALYNDGGSGADTVELGSFTYLIPRRAFRNFAISPDHPDKDGHPMKEENEWVLRIGLDNGSGATSTFSNDSLRVYGIYFGGLNTSTLDAYGHSLIKVPSTYPATIVSYTDYGLAPTATVTDASSNTVSEAITRISKVVGRQEGYQITYTIGTDPQRQNAFVDRLNYLLEKAKHEAVNIATGKN